MKKAHILLAVFALSGILISNAATVVSIDDITVVIPNRPNQPNTNDFLPFLQGVNLAGAEFGSVVYPATYGRDYIYPNQDEVDYFLAKGMQVVRLPFTWERLQHSKRAEFDPVEQQRLVNFVTQTTQKGVFVVLDPHNYARYYDQVVGLAGSGVSNEDFADFWSKLARLFKANPRVIFGLMNEPSNMPTEVWLDAANKAIEAIRAEDASNWIFVPGNAYTGAWTWNQDWYGTPNAQVMLGVRDPAKRFLIEVHQYFDSDGSGRYQGEACVSDSAGRDRLVEFTAWLKQHNLRGFLGEFGIVNTPRCVNAMRSGLDYINANRDVWQGWSYWAAGPWWGDYPLSIEPRDDGSDAPIMNALEPYLTP